MRYYYIQVHKKQGGETVESRKIVKASDVDSVMKIVMNRYSQITKFEIIREFHADDFIEEKEFII